MTLETLPSRLQFPKGAASVSYRTAAAASLPAGLTALPAGSSGITDLENRLINTSALCSKGFFKSNWSTRNRSTM